MSDFKAVLLNNQKGVNYFFLPVVLENCDLTSVQYQIVDKPVILFIYYPFLKKIPSSHPLAVYRHLVA